MSWPESAFWDTEINSSQNIVLGNNRSLALKHVFYCQDFVFLKNLHFKSQRNRNYPLESRHEGLEKWQTVTALAALAEQ